MLEKEGFSPYDQFLALPENERAELRLADIFAR